MKKTIISLLVMLCIFLSSCQIAPSNQQKESVNLDKSVVDTIVSVEEDHLSDSETTFPKFLLGHWEEFESVGEDQIKPLKTPQDLALNFAFKKNQILAIYYGEELFSTSTIEVEPGLEPFFRDTYSIRPINLKNKNNLELRISLNKTKDTLSFSYASDLIYSMAKKE